jgi:hypothetical protein
MAVDYGTLAQVHPASSTDTTLYTVPSNKEVVVSSLVISNSQGSASTFRIAVRPGGETLANKHYTAFDVPIAAGVTLALTIGMTLAAGDVITVRSASTRLGFSLFGMVLDV